MGFFGIGTWEILLILVVALIIWGPGKLPEIARTLGRTVRALKKATFDLTTTVTREIEGKEDNKSASQPKENPADKTPQPSSGAGKTQEPHRNDQPTKPGRESAAK